MRVRGNANPTAKIHVFKAITVQISHHRHTLYLYHSQDDVIVTYKLLKVMLLSLNRPCPILWLKVALVSCFAV